MLEGPEERPHIPVCSLNADLNKGKHVFIKGERSIQVFSDGLDRVPTDARSETNRRKQGTQILPAQTKGQMETPGPQQCKWRHTAEEGPRFLKEPCAVTEL